MRAKRARGAAGGEATRRLILDRALALFRKRGYVKTTMRDVAAAADMSLGAAYYYFPSKESIVLGYYELQNEEHTARCREAFAGTADLRARLGAAFHTKLDLIQKDRKLIGALFHSVGDPESPVSVFSSENASLRRQAVGLFEEALDGQGLAGETRSLVAEAYWALLMGVMLYFIYDTSPKQGRTRKLVDGALDMAAGVTAMIELPALAQVRGRLLSLLQGADLLLSPEAPGAAEPRVTGGR